MQDVPYDCLSANGDRTTTNCMRCIVSRSMCSQLKTLLQSSNPKLKSKNDDKEVVYLDEAQPV